MLSPVSCRCLAALDVSRRDLCWRMGCELPALLPDGENTFPVPLPACCHIPDSPDSCGSAASGWSSLQVFGFSRIALLKGGLAQLLLQGCHSDKLLQGKQWFSSSGQTLIICLDVTGVLFPCLIPDLCCSRACWVPWLWPGSPRCTLCTAPSALWPTGSPRCPPQNSGPCAGRTPGTSWSESTDHSSPGTAKGNTFCAKPTIYC